MWTQERIKRFWEYLGFRFEGDKRFVGFPDGTLRPIKELPLITDLNALFKWAVPKLREINSEILIRFMFGSVNGSGIYQWTKKYSRKKNFEWLEMGAANNDNSAQSLAEAIEKALGIG